MNKYKTTLFERIKKTYLSKDFILFVFCGGMGTLINFIVSLFISTKNNPSIAYIGGYFTGIFFTYSLNAKLIFHSKISVIQFITFIISYIPNFFILFTFVLFFLNVLGWNKIIVYGMAGLLGLPLTFILVKLIGFRKKDKTKSCKDLEGKKCQEKMPNSILSPVNSTTLFTKASGYLVNMKQQLYAIKANILDIFYPPPPHSENLHILEFGCGIGRNVPYFKEFFPEAHIYGCDISEESIRRACTDFPDCRFDTINTPEDLQMYDGVIDCVFISTVLHHIPHQEHEAWIKALHRIMKKGAYIVIFEMNMYNPIAKRFVDKCAFDKNAVMLKPSYCKKLVKDIFGQANLAYTFFFPWRNKFFTMIEHTLYWLPLGAQYYVAGKK